jgi:hypothetical protein
VSSFNVVAGGFLDIDVKVYGPDNKVVFEAEREKDGAFQFVANTNGEYRLCFGNTMSTVTGKTVSFHMFVGNALAKHHAAKQGTHTTAQHTHTHTHTRARVDDLTTPAGLRRPVAVLRCVQSI